MTPSIAAHVAYEIMRQPFEWGLGSDCTVACVAFARLHGIDPLAGAGCRYATFLGAARILKRAGGYLAWCNQTFALSRRYPAQSGDLALIKSDCSFGAALALCIQPGMYAAKTPDALAIVQGKEIGAWTCHS